MGLLIVIGSLMLTTHFKKVDNSALLSYEEKIENKEVTEELNPGDGVGIIDIESIDLRNIIVESIADKNLKYHVCHFEDSALPGDNGNFAIAGHSSTYYQNQVFNNLHEAKVGDKIKITTVEDEFVYTITKMFTVESDAMEVLDQDMSKKEITIVTCTNGGKQRLIVKGEIL